MRPQSLLGATLIWAVQRCVTQPPLYGHADTEIQEFSMDTKLQIQSTDGLSRHRVSLLRQIGIALRLEGRDIEELSMRRICRRDRRRPRGCIVA
jgi:hypothetical protein